MKCSDIKTHLSAHLDNASEAQTAKIIEDHFGDCNACRQTLTALQAVVEEVSNLETAKPPDDFLEQLHIRMDSRFSPKNWMTKLFRPLHIKLPLQLVTATALGVMIFFMVQTQEPLILSERDTVNALAVKHKQILSQDAPTEVQSKLRKRKVFSKVASAPPIPPHSDKEEPEIEEKFEAEKPMPVKAEQLQDMLIASGKYKSDVKPKNEIAKNKTASVIVSPDTVIELALVLNPEHLTIEKRSVNAPFHKVKPKKYLKKPRLNAASQKLTLKDKGAEQSYGIMPETGELNDTVRYKMEHLKKKTAPLSRAARAPKFDAVKATPQEKSKTSERQTQKLSSAIAPARSAQVPETKRAIRQPVLGDKKEQSELLENSIEPKSVSSQEALARIINLSKSLQGKVLDVPIIQTQAFPVQSRPQFRPTGTGFFSDS